MSDQRIIQQLPTRLFEQKDPKIESVRTESGAELPQIEPPSPTFEPGQHNIIHPQGQPPPGQAPIIGQQPPQIGSNPPIIQQTNVPQYLREQICLDVHSAIWYTLL